MKKSILAAIAILFLIGCGDDNSAKPKEICHKETYCEYKAPFARSCTREATREVCEEIRY